MSFARGISEKRFFTHMAVPLSLGIAKRYVYGLFSTENIFLLAILESRTFRVSLMQVWRFKQHQRGTRGWDSGHEFRVSTPTPRHRCRSFLPGKHALLTHATAPHEARNDVSTVDERR